MTSEKFYESMVELFTRMHPDRDLSNLKEDENLFDRGLVDSLRIIEVMVHMESLLHIKIPIGGILPRDFHSIRSMYHAFVERRDPS